jgi:predicted MFS family arabinose efflux permease
LKEEILPGSVNLGSPCQKKLKEDVVEYSMTRALVLLLAVATGMTVASIYYAQPLLEAIRAALRLDVTGAGLIITASQLGYAIGLALLVPLGDLFERRKLVVIMTFGIAAGLAGIGFSSNGSILLLLSVVVGALSVVAQILVAFSADLAGAAERGRVVGTVMSGLLLGVLLARTVAGVLAQIWGWRMVFWLAAVSMVVIALAMYRGLPFRKPNVDYGYPALLKSMPMIFIEERILRLRSLYGAIAFAIFSALWTPLAFLLSKSPFNYEPGIIGLFGLAGVAGATAASVAGRLADRGSSGRTTFAAIVLLIVSWLPIWWGRHSVLLLIAGLVLADLGVQSLHITNQSEIYRLRPEARSRLTSAYMSCFFIGGVVGSSVSALVYAKAGWTGVCSIGAAFGLLAAMIWVVERNGQNI